MDSRLSAGLSVLFGLGLLVLVLAVVGPGTVVEQVGRLELRFLAAFLLLAFFNRLLIVYRWDVILSAFGYHVRFVKLLWYYLTSFAFGYLIPSAQMGGEPVRALLLKREGIPVSDALSSVVVDASVGLTTNLLLIAAGFIALMLGVSLPLKLKVSFFIAAGLVGTILCLYYHRVFKGLPLFTPVLSLLGFTRRRTLLTIYRKVERTERRVTDFFRGKQAALLEVTILSALSMSILIMEFWFALLAVGYDPTLIEAFLALAAQSMAYMAPLPASLGAQEAGQAVMGVLAGFGGHIGVALSMVIRFRDTLLTLFGSTFLVLRGPKTARQLFSEFVKERKELLTMKQEREISIS